jgi:hypothetical protein
MTWGVTARGDDPADGATSKTVTIYSRATISTLISRQNHEPARKGAYCINDYDWGKFLLGAGRHFAIPRPN